jgi:phage terminase Nu1 subunit (DNA packaging protein)
MQTALMTESETAAKTGAAQPPKLLRKKELAQQINSSTRTVATLMENGCPHLKLGTGRQARCLFDLPEVLQWMKENYTLRRNGKLSGQAAARP